MEEESDGIGINIPYGLIKQYKNDGIDLTEYFVDNYIGELSDSDGDQYYRNNFLNNTF